MSAKKRSLITHPSVLLSLQQSALWPQATDVGGSDFYLTYNKYKPIKQWALPQRQLWCGCFLIWSSEIILYLLFKCFASCFLWVDKGIICIFCNIPSLLFKNAVFHTLDWNPLLTGCFYSLFSDHLRAEAVTLPTEPLVICVRTVFPEERIRRNPRHPRWKAQEPPVPRQDCLLQRASIPTWWKKIKTEEEGH